MTVTITSVGLAVTMVGVLIALFTGAYGGRNYGSRLLVSIVVFGVIVPIVLSFLYGFLIIDVTIYDWPHGFYDFPPQMAVLTGCWVGGCLGIKAGNIWQSDSDRSCLQCLLVPISLLVIGAIIVVLLP
jgi:hypothetical protein